MEGAGFYEPLHQESFMKELQSLSKLVYHCCCGVSDGWSVTADTSTGIYSV